MYTVPTANIVAIGCVMVFSFVLPIGLLIFWRRRTKANWSAFFIGCGTFFLFAMVLEQLLHAAVLAITGTALTQNTWLYALYGGLAAGVFEETGRFLAMRFCMKNILRRENAVMYGIGHGGIECMLLLGLSYISNFVMVLMIRSGGVETMLNTLNALPDQEEAAAALQTAVEQLCTLPTWQFYMAGVERISAVMLHIGLSYLVYRAVKEKKLLYYVLAIAIHFFVDAGTIVLMQYVPVIATEIVLLAAVGIFMVLITRQYRNEGAFAKAEMVSEEKI